MKSIISIVVASALAAATFLLAGFVDSSSHTIRVNTSADGVQANDDAFDLAISGNGRFAVFATFANNLVPNDENNVADVFLKDMVTGQIELISVRPDGVQGNHNSRMPTISHDGRYVAFQSYAWNLTPTDGSEWDVFVKDRYTNTLTRISYSSADIGGYAESPSLSGDGRYISFASGKPLVAGDDGWYDVFVKDLVTDEIMRVSTSKDGVHSGNYSSYYNQISADGRFVAFTSNASDLIEGDTNDWEDVFVWERSTGTTGRVSVSSDEVQGNSLSGYERPAINADGRYVAFRSNANNLVPGSLDVIHVYLRDRQMGTTELVSKSPEGEPGHWSSYGPTISHDGRFIAFVSAAQNLLPGDLGWDMPDIFLWDRTLNSLKYVNEPRETNSSWNVTISSSGRHVAFISQNRGLVSGDTNEKPDAFVRDTGFAFNLSFEGDPTAIVGGNNLVGAANLNGPAPAGGQAVLLSDNSTYVITPTEVVVPEGESTAMFLVSTRGVDANVDVKFSATANGTTTERIVRLKPATLANVALNPTTVYGGSSTVLKARINLNGKCGPTPMTVNLATSDPIISVPATVTIEPTRTFVEVPVNHSPLSIRKTVNVAASYKDVVRRGSVLIMPMILQKIEINKVWVYGGSPTSVFVTVTIPEPLPIGVDVLLSSSHPLALSPPASIRVGIGNTTATVKLAHNVVRSDTLVTLTGQLGVFSRTDSLDVLAPTLKTILLDPTIVKGGNSTQGTVFLTAPAPEGGITVDISSDIAAAQPPTTVLVPAGASQVSFSVPTSTVAAAVTATLTASYAGLTKTRALRITR